MSENKIEKARKDTIRAINKRRGVFYCNYRTKYEDCNRGMSLAMALIETHTEPFETAIEAVWGWRNVIKRELNRNWKAKQEDYRLLNRGLIQAKIAVRDLIEFSRASKNLS